MIPRYQNDTGTLLFHHIHRKHNPCQRIERVASESMTPVSELGESPAKLIWHGTGSKTQRFAHFADKFTELSSFPICGCNQCKPTMCKIGDYNSDSELSWFRISLILLRLRLIAKVEYKLISNPFHDRSDLPFKPFQMPSTYTLIIGWLTCNCHCNPVEKPLFRSVGLAYRACMPDFPTSHTIGYAVSRGDYIRWRLTMWLGRHTVL